eukprot:3985265-Pleurochrysis_carterae.AAC.1
MAWIAATCSMIFGNTLKLIGLTPAQDGTCPRATATAKTSVDDLRWYHQQDTGSLERRYSLAR